MTVYLGIDVGTQGLKAVLWSADGRSTARASVPLQVVPGQPAGHSEQLAEDWLVALERAMAELRTADRAGVAAIQGVGVSGQQHGLVALDAADRPLRPAMLWNDVRCGVECAALLAEAGGSKALHDRLGLAALPPGYTVGKLRWLRDHEPATVAAMRRVLLPHDYLNLVLTGRFVAEAGDASGTGYFDVRRRRFDQDFAEQVLPGLGGMLPEVAPADRPIGAVSAAAAARFGIPAGAVVAPGGGDNMMAALGAGAVEPGVVVWSLGTSGTVFGYAADPVCDPAGEVAAFCDSTGAWLPLGCTMNATVATETVRKLLGADLSTFEELVAGTTDGADGVVCVPFLTGERSPDLPQATGSYLGLTPTNHTPAHLARAAMEGATYALRRLNDRLAGLGVEARELRLTGGGSKSATWRRLCADVSGLPVRDGVDPDAAALGAALQAAWVAEASGRSFAAFRDGLGVDAALTDPLLPDPTRRALHDDRSALWLTAVETLTPLYPKLAR